MVFQFPISTNWIGVAPAQVIFSGHHSSNTEIVTAGASSSVPISITTNGGSSGLSATAIPGAACPNGGNSLLTLFPRGVQVNDPENMWTAEVQAPTPWVTFDGKYYNGANLRWFFGGVQNSVYPSPGPGLVAAGSATSFSGQTILFGCPSGLGLPTPTKCDGPITLGSLNPVRGQGGFAEASFPLSRIFHADPEGHNAGWTAHFLFGTDRANGDDARKGNGLTRDDYWTGSLSYKLNKWLSFTNEVTYYDTRAAANATSPTAPCTPGGKLFSGQCVNVAHAWRQEFGTIVTF